MTALEVRDLTAAVGERVILKGVDLDLPYGEVHALMGPNGSGKSTLCHVLSGRPGYLVAGRARLDGVDLLDKPVDARARLGLLQGFQYPTEIPGVRLRDFLAEAGEEWGIEAHDLTARVDEATAAFGMERFLDRSLNDDLSGGEKKRSEIFQMSVLRPKVMVLDEIDSGLDIDAVREVAEAVEASRGSEVGVLMITHYSRILRYVRPDRIHVLIDGRIVESGGPEVADELESGGYDGLRHRLGLMSTAPAAPRPASTFFTETPFD
jgi:Fe-S cluster assembly ATP-binding protein